MKNKYYSLAVDNNDRTADLYIFGDIVDAFSTGIDEAWGIDTGAMSGLSIVKELQELDVDTINVHIDSCGGYTSEGLAIYNVLKSSKAKINTYCDGFACSAASIIFMVGNERIMGTASALMIHNAWAGASGNGAQLRQQADVLDKISQIAANTYAEKVSISREELDAMLDGENHEGTWIAPQEAVDMGFATSISTEEAESSLANQSAKQQIFQRIFAKPQSVSSPTVRVTLDTAKLEQQFSALGKAAKEASDRMKAMRELPAQPIENKTTNLDRLKAVYGKKAE